MNILIVDDDPISRELLHAQLESEGMTLLDAADGVEALSVLEHERVDAIISDILMPRMDGYRLCYEVRKSERWRAIPFIIYSLTYTSSSDEKLCYELGADKYVRKTAAPEAILGALHEVMNPGGVRAHKRFTLPEELTVVKKYNEQLVAKLEQKNTELFLKASALEAAANSVMITDVQGEILWVNPAFTALTGYTAAEVIGKNPRLLKSGQHDQAHYQNLWRTILDGHTRRGESVNRRKDGSLYHNEQTITPVRAHGGPITHFIGIMNDVTERKWTEMHLRRLNRVYAVLSDINQVIVRVHDPQMTPWQEDARRLGYRALAVLPLTVDGEKLGSFNLCTSAPCFFDDEEMRMLDELAMDIGFALEVSQHEAERKTAENDKEQERILSGSIINSLPGIFYLIDAHGRFLRWNVNFEKISGYSADEIGRLHPLDLFAGEDKELIRQRIQAVFQNGASDAEAHLVAKAGTCSPYYLTGVRVCLERQFHLVGMGLDITERKRAEAALKQRVAELERFHRLTVGRELQMIDLKREVNELCQRLNEPVRYDLSLVPQKGAARAGSEASPSGPVGASAPRSASFPTPEKPH